MDNIITGNQKLFTFLKTIDFKCQQCSACCRIYPGAVFLTKNDAEKIANYLGLDFNSFLQEYCRGIERKGKKIVSLKEMSNYDCILWNEGCTVYPVRPLQCITYPFWPSLVESEKNWHDEAKYCKGINKDGKLSLKKKIELYLEEKQAEYLEYKF